MLGNGRAGADTAPGRWLRIESQNFIVLSSVNEADTREEIAALEVFHALLKRVVPSSSGNPPKLPVYFAGKERDFEMSAPQMRSDVAGFYDAGIEEIRAVTSAAKGRQRQRDVESTERAFDARLILFHEYTHHYMLANNQSAFPAWYVEGFAEYLSTADFSAKGASVGKFTPNRASWLANGN